MAIIKPFNAVRPKQDMAKAVASKPYDVLSSEEARDIAKDNPQSFLHVTKSEIDLPVGTDPHSQQVYNKAKENLLHSIHTSKVLFREHKPCYYIYKLVMPALEPGGEDKNQTGLVCASSVDDYREGIIKKHEFTRPEKEKDRIDQMSTIRAQTGNVFLAYRDVDALNSLIEDWKTNCQPA
ncbi:MAG TPA: DUF1015 domain-containing protein, partial [Chitinophagaceae bacterium]|nr:DUF1015 domain-containing protein [Chitinophagaceae bacterium]